MYKKAEMPEYTPGLSALVFTKVNLLLFDRSKDR